MKLLHKTLLVCSVLASLTGMSQKSSIDRENDNIRRARANLAAIEKLTRTNSAEVMRSEQDITLAHNEIVAQREVVAALEEQMARLSEQIAEGSARVHSLDSTLTVLKKEYGAQVYSAWKSSKLNSTAAFLLASRDFNDATRRISFIRLYNKAHRQRGVQIDSMSRSLSADIEDLNAAKDVMVVLKADNDATLASLALKEAEYSSALEALKKDGKRLEANAKREREKIAAAQKQINNIMAEQAKAEKERIAKAGVSATDTALSGRFEENKGKLPWPAGGPGTILDRFGSYRTWDGVMKNSLGITIATPSGSEARAVFEGRVTGIYGIAQYEKCIFVRSGSYTLVYGNLLETKVKVGDTVTVNQPLGVVDLSEGSDKHVLMFQIWQDHKTALNPVEWLRR